MKQILLGLGRGLVILGTAFGMATATNLENHKGYWDGTIKRVQTTDFNILSHTLPAKLSLALLQNNKVEIQRTLNSNYGLFGIVVTNCTKTAWECSDQQILYMTESNKSWREKLNPENLHYHPFDLLRDPPPVLTEMGYEDSRDQSWELTNKRNSGKVIGRVYYIRGIPPSFQETYTAWLSKLPGSLLKDSGASKYYSLTFGLFGIGGLASWGLIEWLSHSKRDKERQFQRSMRDMQLQLNQSHEDSQKRLQQVSDRIKERVRYIKQLESYQRDQDNHVRQLHQIIAQLESKIAAEMTPVSSELLEQTQANLESEIQQQQADILALQEKIAAREQDSTQNRQVIAQLNQKLASAIEQRNQSQLAMADLHRQIVLKEEDRVEMQRLVVQWREEVQAAQLREAEAKQQWQAIQDSLSALKQQKAELESQIQEFENPDLNEFEKLIVSRLNQAPKATKGTWLIRPSKDVSHGSGPPQFVDCLVFAHSCVVIIEAKNYAGRIEAEGEAKQTRWFLLKDGQRIEIKSCHGCNPYEQVNTYSRSIMGRLKSAMNEGSVSIYNFVVFPNDADLSAIKPEIENSYSRVLRLGELISAVNELEQKAINRSKVRGILLSPQQIEDMMFRRLRLKNRNQRDIEHRDAA